MLSIFMKYFCIIFCCFYAYHKIMNINTHRIAYLLIQFIFPCCIAFSITLPFISTTTVRIIIMLLVCLITLPILTNHNLYISLATVLTSLGISFLFYTFASFLVSIVFVLFYKTYTAIPYSQTDIPTGCCQIALILMIFKYKRFKKGLFNLISSQYSDYGIIFSFLLIMYISFVSTNAPSLNQTVREKILPLSLTFAFFLLYYWNHRITQTYKEKLRLANQKSLEDELTAKLTEIETLKADNERLAKIIHKDNKLIPAMHMAVTDFLENIDKLPSEELSTRGQELSVQLYKMAQDRQGILNETHSKTNTLPQTGIHTIDGVLSYMETRAAKENITYRLRIDENIKELILNSVSEEDLCHLLGDLIENAIIATRYSNNNKQIKIHLGTLKNSILLEISDSGKEFDIETYQHFGYEKHTTHAEHGGSGIGLMDIWKIKKQNKMSLQIYEYLPNTNIYSKKISFIFDSKNHFLIQTYRHKEIINTLTRGDLYVFPYESNH